MKAWQRSGSKARRNAVALELVVARGDPDLAVRGDPNLRGAQHVAGRMKRKLDAVARQDLAVRRRLDRDVAEALAQDRRRVAMADVNIRAEARVVGMRMGDDGARDRAPGIDVKIARGAIEAAVGGSDEVQGCLRSMRKAVIALYGDQAMPTNWTVRVLARRSSKTAAGRCSRGPNWTRDNSIRPNIVSLCWRCLLSSLSTMTITCANNRCRYEY